MKLRHLLGAAAALLTCFAAGAEADDKVFFGNLHSHTSYSDGSGTPDDAFRHARHVAHLDFLAVTEHNHAAAESGAGDRQDGLLIATNPSLYNGAQSTSLISAARAWTVDGEFVALYGQEFSSISSGNHVNVFDVGEVIDAPNGRFDTLLNTWIPTHLDSSGRPAILQLNHPALFRNPLKAYGADDFGSAANWLGKLDERARLIEVLNGPAMARDGGHEPAERMESDFLSYLRLGFHLAPTADQDNHYLTWGSSTDARTAVITDQLTKAKILEAMRARHVYATEDKNLRLVFKVDGHLMGDRVPAPPLGSALSISYSIEDDDEPAASYTIQVISNTIGGTEEAELANVTQEGNTTTGTISGVQYTGQSQYFLFKVTQAADGADGADHAWTAPIWLEPTGATTGPTANPDELLVASKKSAVYHVSAECRSARMIADRNRITGPAAKGQGRHQHFECPLL